MEINIYTYILTYSKFQWKYQFWCTILNEVEESSNFFSSPETKVTSDTSYSYLQ
jgi:hypothetical protein